MDKIDWGNVNKRSVRKYEEFLNGLEVVAMTLEDAEKLIVNHEPSKTSTWQQVEPEELKQALENAREDLRSIRVKAIKNEAQLKSWEWT